jgi:RimJ/RimL family protein N-acetyltransferase
MEPVHLTRGVVSIVPTTLWLLELEDRGGGPLAVALGVAPPPVWPPQYNDAGTRAWIRTLLTEHPDEPGFASWYVIAAGELVGIAGFKGAPNALGDVEIGYAIIEPRQRKGYASAAVELLVQFAFAAPRVTAVRAETLLDGIASQGVLRRAGFAADGTRLDPDDGEVACFRRTG